MSLSEQQLVDCTYRSDPWDGCNGGWMGDAYFYLYQSIGSQKTSAYPVKKCFVYKLTFKFDFLIYLY
jgi:hypothetical protein